MRGLPGQVVLVLQGGGALGAYQAGVYEALRGAGIGAALALAALLAARLKIAQSAPQPAHA